LSGERGWAFPSLVPFRKRKRGRRSLWTFRNRRGEKLRGIVNGPVVTLLWRPEKRRRGGRR